MLIREARAADEDALWHILEPVIRAGETYPLPRDMARAEALATWQAPTNTVFVAETPSEGVLGTAYLRANTGGGGSHVANAGFMVAPDAGGRGIATTLCRAVLKKAREAGFRAMQFNLVISTNTHAIALWQRLGFFIVGTLPGAFAHPVHGFVDAHVMMQDLTALPKDARPAGDSRGHTQRDR